MKRFLIIVALLCTSLSVVGCTSSTNKNENQQTFEMKGDSTEGYKVFENKVTNEGIIQKVILSKKFTQAELENAVKSQNTTNSMVTVEFYNSEDEIKQNKPYTIAKIVVKDDVITYTEAKQIK